MVLLPFLHISPPHTQRTPDFFLLSLQCLRSVKAPPLSKLYPTLLKVCVYILSCIARVAQEAHQLLPSWLVSRAWVTVQTRGNISCWCFSVLNTVESIPERKLSFVAYCIVFVLSISIQIEKCVRNNYLLRLGIDSTARIKILTPSSIHIHHPLSSASALASHAATCKWLFVTYPGHVEAWRIIYIYKRIIGHVRVWTFLQEKKSQLIPRMGRICYKRDRIEIQQWSVSNASSAKLFFFLW